MSYAAADGFAMPCAIPEKDRGHFSDGEWVVPPLPEHARLNADFTGVQSMSDANRLSERELARSRAEDEEAGGWEQQTFQNDVDIHELAPPAGDYPDGNPKTLMGAQKPDLSVVPPIGILHLATAMMNGADKYGPFNWRYKAISTRPYITAALRHLFSYLDGEDFSADTTEAGRPVHHLGHVMACCAIILDAESIGQLNDNRPGVDGKTGEAIEQYREKKRL